MRKRRINNILAILSAALFILLFIPNIDVYLKGVALILLSINFWIDVDLNSVTKVILTGRGGPGEETSNKKIAITTTVLTVFVWVYLLLGNA